MQKFDVITLGETMLRLTPPGLKRIEQATSFELEAGGSESNVAIGLARLGLSVAWISRLTRNPLGRLVEQLLSGQGIDTSHVVWTDQDRVGLYFLERGRAPRNNEVTYDRQHSAFSLMKPEELPADLFKPDGASLLHLTGITPALGTNISATARQALRLAKEAGYRISFDLNYRRRLWTPKAALMGCAHFIEQADLLFAPLGDVRLLFELQHDATPEQALFVLREQNPGATVIVTLGKNGAMACEPESPVVFQEAFSSEEVDRLGTGDAFVAGFLFRLLTSDNNNTRLGQSLKWGAAMAALKYSTPGEPPMVNREDIEVLLHQGDYPGSEPLR